MQNLPWINVLQKPREISWINEFPPNENKYQKKFLACFIFLVFEIFKSLFTPYN